MAQVVFFAPLVFLGIVIDIAVRSRCGANPLEIKWRSPFEGYRRAIMLLTIVAVGASFPEFPLERIAAECEWEPLDHQLINRDLKRKVFNCALPLLLYGFPVFVAYSNVAFMVEAEAIIGGSPGVSEGVLLNCVFITAVATAIYLFVTLAFFTRLMVLLRKSKNPLAGYSQMEVLASLGPIEKSRYALTPNVFFRVLQLMSTISSLLMLISGMMYAINVAVDDIGPFWYAKTLGSTVSFTIEFVVVFNSAFFLRAMTIESWHHMVALLLLLAVGAPLVLFVIFGIPHITGQPLFP